MFKLSIITINYNNCIGLQKTIESIVCQTFTNYEYIVIDGGSTDGSVSVIKKYSDKINYWISETDSGIYNAMNKGIAKATGEYCLFLNSGDYLVDENVLDKTFKHSISSDIIYGDMIIDWGNGNLKLAKMPEEITFYQMFIDTLWHPVSFIKRNLFQLYGNYNEQYKLVADYDFFFKTIIVNDVSTHHLPIAISVFKADGASSNPENKVLEKTERENVHKAYLPSKVILFANTYNQLLLDKKQNWINRLTKKVK